MLPGYGPAGTGQHGSDPSTTSLIGHWQHSACVETHKARIGTAEIGTEPPIRHLALIKRRPLAWLLVDTPGPTRERRFRISSLADRKSYAGLAFLH